MNCKFFIKRYENSEANKIVGFDVICKNGGKKYFETIINLKLCFDKNDNEICCMAYEQMKNNIIGEMEKIENVSVTRVGEEFLPPDIEQEISYEI